MGYNAKVGSFNIDTAKTAGQTQSITDVGFQPKIVLFWWSGSTATGDEVAGGTVRSGFGAAIDSTHRFNCSGFSSDNVDTSSAYRYSSNASVIQILTDAAPTIEGVLDFSSMDADGFTLIVDDQFANSYRISYLALGGDDLTNVCIGNKLNPIETGEFIDTGVGFEADAIIFVGAHTAAVDNGSADLAFSLGFAINNSNQGAVAINTSSVEATSKTWGYGYNGEVVDYIRYTGLIHNRNTFVNFLSNGFTLNALEAVYSYYFFYIALKGGQYSVGDITTRTDGNDIVETVGFQPAALLFASVNRALSTQDTATSNNRLSIGLATSISNRAVQAISDENGLATTETAHANYDSAVYAFIQDDATVGLMDLKSIDDDGFTCVMDDADPSGCWVTYLAIGANEESESISPSASVSPSESPSVSPSVSPSISPSASASPSAPACDSLLLEDESYILLEDGGYLYLEGECGGLIEGTTCWGHVTGVTETNVRTFADHWTGTGDISGSGDAEKICLNSGEYMISEVVITGIKTIELTQNQYDISGDTIKLRYRHGNTQAACEAASWNDYTVPFLSLGYVQVRIESTL